MELSLFLGQLIGLTMVLVSIAGLIRPGMLKAAVKDFDHESFSTLAVGYIAIAAGLAIVLAHNSWDGGWRIWITLFGWAALIKGFLYLVAPKTLIDMSRGILRNSGTIRTFLVILLIIGAYIAYKAFGY